MKIIDKLRESILPLLLRMINQINETSIFPDSLKISRIIPIRKSWKESKMDINNCTIQAQQEEPVLSNIQTLDFLKPNHEIEFASFDVTCNALFPTPTFISHEFC